MLIKRVKVTWVALDFELEGAFTTSVPLLYEAETIKATNNMIITTLGFIDLLFINL